MNSIRFKLRFLRSEHPWTKQNATQRPPQKVGSMTS